ncbi:ectoine/hydroxyectoine ABC transporter substrate-binding protein EhuB [Allokutzneria oryzae]|uniref:Ectoine/hydroxyectoine ABC transporter substrate-binding protein EhuB n=1 Tax=Allokutzneria oryzae TaxID=1378989 RepID=A0ABV6A0A7_9PSEU
MCAEHVTRRNFLRGTAGGALAVAIGVSACAPVDLTAQDAGGDLLSRIRDRGEVNIGIANESPYGFVDSAGRITGEAPELARIIFQRLGVERMNPRVTDFGSLIPALQVGVFDVIAAGMFITPARCKQILFSDPEYQAPQTLLVPKGNPKGVNTLDDIVAKKDVRVGLLTGSAETTYADALGLKDRSVIFDSVFSGLDGILANRADAFALTTISLRDAVSKRPDAPLELTPAYVPIIEGEQKLGCGAFGFRRDQRVFRDAFNAELNRMRANGELLATVRPFGFTESEMTKLTVAELCTDTSS